MHWMLGLPDARSPLFLEVGQQLFTISAFEAFIGLFIFWLVVKRFVGVFCGMGAVWYLL
jgi:hypothetical protein